MLPHIKNSKAGINRQEPVYTNLFEVYLTVPDVLKGRYDVDEVLLAEQMIKIGGLATLFKGVDTIEQKFMGTTRTYLANKLDDTSHELKLDFNLNLRDATDNYIAKLFVDWRNLGYNPATGETSIKEDYVGPQMRLIIYSRNGAIHTDVVYHDLILKGDLTYLDELDYTSNDPVTFSVSMKSDWADLKMA